MTPQEEIRHAGDARYILDQPLFVKAKEEVYKHLRESRQKLPTSMDAQVAMDLVRTEQIADMFFDYFTMVMQTGQLAEVHQAAIDAQAAKKQSGMRLFSILGRNGM